MSKIPQHKHSEDELAELRAQKAMQMAGQPVVNPYEKKLAKKPVIILGYLCASFAPLYLILLKFKSQFSYEILDLKIMAVGIILAIVIAAFVFLTRTLSRHHASFMIIIALISSFSMAYLVEKDPSLKRQVAFMLGQEAAPMKSEADRIVEESLKKQTGMIDSGTKLNPDLKKKVLTPEEIQLRKEAKKAFAESEAEIARRFESEQRLKEIQNAADKKSQ